MNVLLPICSTHAAVHGLGSQVRLYVTAAGEVLPESAYKVTDKTLTILEPPTGEFELQVRPTSKAVVVWVAGWVSRVGVAPQQCLFPAWHHHAVFEGLTA